MSTPRLLTLFLSLSVAALVGCEFDPFARNTAPVCHAGPDFAGLHGAENTVDGSGTYDRDGDALSYRWTVLAAPISEAHYSYGDDTRETFVFTPGGAGFGDYVLQLEASDGEETCRDQVVVTIEDRPVTCELGADFTAVVDWTRSVFVEGFAGDPDGWPIDWRWTIVDGPADNIGWMNAHNSPGGSLLVPGHSITWHGGEYRLRLETWIEGTTFAEGSLHSCSDEITVTVQWTNTPPVANAGQDIVAVAGQVVTLDASRSSDVDGDALSFDWGARGQPADSGCCVSPHPVNDFTANPTFIPDVPGDYTFAVFVFDGEFTRHDEVVIHVVAAGDEVPEPEGPVAPRDEVEFDVAPPRVAGEFDDAPPRVAGDHDRGDADAGDDDGGDDDGFDLDDPQADEDVRDDAERDEEWNLGACLPPLRGLGALPNLDRLLEPLAECICEFADAPRLLQCQAEEVDRVRIESRTHMTSTRAALWPAWNHGEQGAAQLEQCGTLQRAADEAHDDALALDRRTGMTNLTGQLNVQRAYGRAIGLYTAMRICLVDKF